MFEWSFNGQYTTFLNSAKAQKGVEETGDILAAY